MQIVIDIPDRIYYGAKNSITVNGSEASQILIDAVKNSTPLPKGHGRLIDADALLKKHPEFDAYPFPSTTIDNAQTIIEADMTEITPTRPTCKDCKFKSRDIDFRNLKCPWGERVEMTENDFCSRYESR